MSGTGGGRRPPPLSSRMAAEHQATERKRLLLEKQRAQLGTTPPASLHLRESLTAAGGSREARHQSV